MRKRRNEDDDLRPWAKEVVGQFSDVVDERVGDLREYVDNGFDIVANQLNKRSVHTGATGYMSVTSSKYLDAIPTEQRDIVAEVERSNLPKMYGTDDIPKAAAVAMWFKSAIDVQISKGRDREAQRAFERYDRALGGKGISYGGPITAKTALAEGTDGMGGYAVPTGVGAEVLRLIEDYSVMRGLANKVPMNTSRVDYPTEAGSITAHIGAEAATLTDSVSDTYFSSGILEAKRFHGRGTMSNEFFQDNAIAALEYMQTRFAEEIGSLEDVQCFEGDGTYFTGMNTATGVNSVATTATDGEAPTYDDFVDVVYAARSRISRRGARWFMPPEVLASARKLKDDDSMPIVQNALIGNVPTLLGYPIELMDSLSIAITRGSTGNTANAYFGPPRTVIFGERTGFAFDVSDAPNWDSYSLDFRLVKRTGILVGVPSAWVKFVGILF